MNAEHSLKYRFAVALWSAFIGAIFSFSALLALPAAWFEAQTGMGALSLLFFIAWLAALVPAIAAVVLMQAQPRGPHDIGHE